jgi:hypothetical protein
MWAHYADKHRGLRLEFDADQEFGDSVEVVYRDELLAIGPDILIGDARALADAVLSTKSSEWACENEYRMLAPDAGGDPAFSRATSGDFLGRSNGALKGRYCRSECKYECLERSHARLRAGSSAESFSAKGASVSPRHS